MKLKKLSNPIQKFQVAALIFDGSEIQLSQV